MQKQDLTYKAIYAKLAARTEKYASDVRKVYLDNMGEIAKMCEGLEIDEDKVFRFNDYPEISTKVQEQLRKMYSQLYQCVRGDVVREWYYANDDVDRMVKAMFGKQAADNPHFAKYFQRNKQAMDAFFERKQQGLSLSQRIWQYVGEGKEELELALDLGLGEGKDAGALSRDVRKYLQEPDKLFRRVRDKHGNLVLSKAAQAYHVGQGKYRSSYKNAMRLTRTETNMAYRTADVTRWQQQPFVVGYEVKLSRKHPQPDICNDLAGKYPKGFMFKGWHPHCYCYIVPILCSDSELEELTQRILDGTEDEFTPAGIVPDVPPAFTQWIEDNTDRIYRAKSLPYFIRDNFPNGDITKAGNWVAAGIPNEVGMGSFAQVVAKKDVDLAMFNKVQGYTSKDWEAASNFVEQDADELELLLGKHTAGFDSMYVANDASIYSKLLEMAQKGEAAGWAGYVDATELAELQRITQLQKYASKAEGRFITSMERKQLEAALSADGKTAHLTGVSKWGTHYAKAAGKAIDAADEQVLVVVKTPAGSRYVRTLAGEEQQAVFMPNTKYKVVSKMEKTITKAGKPSKVLQYELELVEDGSKQVQQLTTKHAEVQQAVAGHTKAVKQARNVIKASNKGIFARIDIDTDELEDMLTSGTATSAEIKAKSKELAKAMVAERTAFKQALAEAGSVIADAKQWEELGVSTAQLEAAVKAGTSSEVKAYLQGLKDAVQSTKDALQSTYGDMLPDPLAVYKLHGKAGLDAVYGAVESKMQQWLSDPYKGSDLNWIKKKLEFEIDYVTKNKKYTTWQEAADAYKWQLQKVDSKIQLQPIQAKIDDNITFALSTKSQKTKDLAMELQTLVAGTNGVVDIPAVQAKLAELEKEVTRLKKARKKFTSSAATKLAHTDLDDEHFLKIGNDWAFNYLADHPTIDVTKDAKGKLLNEVLDAGMSKDRAKMDAALKKLGVDLSDPYCQERKDAALWLKSKAEAVAQWEKHSEVIWAKAAADEQKGWYDYTAGSGHMNRPLRGYNNKLEKPPFTKYGWGEECFVGVGKVPLDNETPRGLQNTTGLHRLLERCEMPADQWLQRGIETADGTKGFFGASDYASIKAMIGQEVTDFAFMSTGTAKGSGFSGHCILNIYAPKGSKGVFSWTHSAFKHNNETETTLQLGTRFKIIKVEHSGSQLYVDLEIVGYDKHPLL